MLIIGLFGGNEDQRSLIAEKILSLSAHVSVFDMRNPVEEEQRLTVTRQIINTRHSYHQSLLLLTIKSEREAQLLREKGVIFAVVEGSVPEVAVQKGDLFVTSKETAQRHFLTAESMFSKARLLHQKRQPQKRLNR